MKYTWQEIFSSMLLKKTIKGFLGHGAIEIINRPACFFIINKKENKAVIRRLIVLPPYGFTSDEIDLLNPHPEALTAKIKILGKLDPSKKGYKPIKAEIQFNFSIARDMPTENSSAYARISKKYTASKNLSWKNWVYVVKESGWGNFHNLVNLSDEWVVICLEKELVDQKKIDVKTYLSRLPQSKAKELSLILRQISENGDESFKDKALLKKLNHFESSILIPIFLRMLNIQETGKHQPCTFFALLLKIAKKDKSLVLNELESAIKLQVSPRYYLEDLAKKLTART
jgi:hypothetical protein